MCKFDAWKAASCSLIAPSFGLNDCKSDHLDTHTRTHTHTHTHTHTLVRTAEPFTGEKCPAWLDIAQTKCPQWFKGDLACDLPPADQASICEEWQSKQECYKSTQADPIARAGFPMACPSGTLARLPLC